MITNLFLFLQMSWIRLVYSQANLFLHKFLLLPLSPHLLFSYLLLSPEGSKLKPALMGEMRCVAGNEQMYDKLVFMYPLYDVQGG